MGTGSFGGGSGSFGGSSGGGPGSGGPGGGGVAVGRDSAQERILGLNKLTDAFNANPEIAKVSAAIYKLLQDRTRAAFLKALLTDPMVVSAYKALLSLNDELRGGATLEQASAKLKPPANAKLIDLAETIAERGVADDSDERAERIVRRAVTHLLLRTVGNQQDLFYEKTLATVGRKFDGTPLRNTADTFLGTLIREVTKGDLLSLSDEAKAVIGDASHQIALAWTDKFKDRDHKKGVPFWDMLSSIAADYSTYAVRSPP